MPIVHRPPPTLVPVLHLRSASMGLKHRLGGVSGWRSRSHLVVCFDPERLDRRVVNTALWWWAKARGRTAGCGRICRIKALRSVVTTESVPVPGNDVVNKGACRFLRSDP
jgi:hypothetical protein